MTKEKISIFWFRRDLRLDDNTGLYNALTSNHKVLALFIFDTEILDKLENKNDARVNFIYDELVELKKNLEKMGTSLLIKKGKPIEIFEELIKEYNIAKVFTNIDYEPYGIQRDGTIDNYLNDKKVRFLAYKDHVIYEKNEIVKIDGKPYTVFTPYKNRWLIKFNREVIKCFDCELYFNNFIKIKAFKMPTLKEIGFKKSNLIIPAKEIPVSIIENYAKTRDYPAIETTGIGLHLRFGTISIRKTILLAKQYSEIWLSELIWREFFMQILFHFPHVEKGAFKPQYNNIKWNNNEKEFQLWCKGKTGYAIVDAGMRELNATGFMHNRVRMITASFLCKHLLIDWRWGEAYFAKQLLDFELSSNNGNWQWAAGTGCDAAPYFRIFNPIAQTQKFDSKLTYIKKWVHELNDLNYFHIVDHQFARERCLKAYKEIF
jgi:deoxyribodipyrimidine photo-lyase